MVDTAVQDAETIEGAESLSTVAQYVSFLIREDLFAFGIDMVQEIIRVPTLLKVPLAPQSMLGLANLRGEVLPVFDLRSMLSVETRDVDDASRVIVVDDGARFGLVVDRVTEVLNVPEDRIENAAAIEQTIASDILTGVVKNFSEHPLIQLVDPSRLPDIQASDDPAALATGLGTSNGGGRSLSVNDDEGWVTEDVLQIVSVHVGAEEYAFQLSVVDEIVRVPSQISAVPKSPPEVLGITTMRDRVLPLISLRTCLGLAAEDIVDSNRIIVLQLTEEGGAVRHIGVLVDRVREVLRVPRTDTETVPLGFGGSQSSEIECICKLDQGKRLISLLDVAEVFGGVDLEAASKEAARLQTVAMDMSEEASMSEMVEGEGEDTQLVVFKLAEEEFGVSIHSVREIIRLPEHFVAVPNTKGEIEGIINLRGVVLPVIDMRRYFGLADCERNERQRIIVLSIEGTVTGYIVDSVTEVLTLQPGALNAPPKLNSAAAKFVKHVAQRDEGKKMVMVLEGDAFDAVSEEKIEEMQLSAEEVAAE